jgi:RHS repeat-associated protein
MANRLAAIQVRKAGGVWECSNYLYDAFGQRVAKLWRQTASRDSRNGCGTSGPPNSATIYVHDLQGQLLGEYRATDGAPLKEYLWLGSTPVAVVVYDTTSAQSGELMHIHTDHLDTPRVIQDRAGRVRWMWLAEPFGNQAPNQDPQGIGELTFNLRMPGQYFDREVGLFFNRARYYDAGLGRYVTPDPLGLEAGDLSLYTYANSAPTKYTDPDGLQAIPMPVPAMSLAPWAAPAAVGIGSYWLTDRYVNPWLQPYISRAIDWCMSEKPSAEECRKRKQQCFAECQYELDFPGRTGHDNMLRFRACVRRCMNAAGCDY